MAPPTSSGQLAAGSHDVGVRLVNGIAALNLVDVGGTVTVYNSSNGALARADASAPRPDQD